MVGILLKADVVIFEGLAVIYSFLMCLTWFPVLWRCVCLLPAYNMAEGMCLRGCTE